MKNTNINTYTNDLLKLEDFKNALQFEADHAIELKGGHSPLYSGKQTRRRLVDPINLLSQVEKQDLIHNIFTSKN